MTNKSMKHLPKVFLVFLSIFLSIIFVKTSFAQSDTINISFEDTTYGKVTQSLGVKGSGITEQGAQDVISTFGQTPIYIKLVNPTTGSITAPQFQTLANAGHKWYFLFTQNTSVTSVLDAYKNSYPLTNLVVELEIVDASFIQTLKTNYPGIRVHVGHLPVWPRSQVNQIYAAVQPPTIEGISFWIGTINRGSVFDDVKLTFDTFFDASKSIAGEEINHPANAILSVSDSEFPSYNVSAQKTAYLAGLISSTIVSSVQSQGRGGEAPIRYVIPGAFSDLSSSERVLVNHFARFMANQPDVVWPEAISNNGDPWDNAFLSNGNTKPIVGVIGKLPTVTNSLYGFLTNTDPNQVFADVGNRIDFTTHRATSILTGAQATIDNGVFPIAAYDTIVIHPNNFPSITPATATATPTTVGQQPTATSAPVASCDQMKKQGNYNCTGGVDETDFIAWKESYVAKSSALAFFEYLRRVVYQ